MILALLACVDTDTSGLCTGGDTWMDCEHHTFVVEDRDVHWQAPEGDGPFGIVFLFQGSFAGTDLFWSGNSGLVFGGWQQVRMVSQLLDAGFVVVTPAADLFWNTNVPWWSEVWDTSPDAALMEALFAEVDGGTFGDVDPTDWHAAGISSGGYMSSRMAIEFPDRFVSIAIESGSYATCLGMFCSIPALPDDHPPTLFLHGELDNIVPVGTMRDYDEALDIETRVVTDPWGGHGWIPGAAEEVVAWFVG